MHAHSLLYMYFAIRLILLQQIKKEHDVHDEATHFQVRFCGDEILLNLEKKCTDKRWSILPLVYPCKVFVC